MSLGETQNKLKSEELRYQKIRQEKAILVKEKIKAEADHEKEEAFWKIKETRF